MILKNSGFKMLNKILLFVLILIFAGCSNKSKDTNELHVAANAWIGYTPIFYLNATGALKKLHIKLLYTVSLDESSELFENGEAELIATTQHEYYSLKQITKNIVPVILLDRSNGGDMILSNKTLKELKTSKKIYAYLEIDSINNEILKSFLKKTKLNQKNIVFINSDQLQISKLKNETSKAMIIVTYSPYNIALQRKGFNVLASSKNINSIIIIDSLDIRKTLFHKEKDRLKKLKILIDETIEKIQENPKIVYQNVKLYLNNISYNEFLKSLKLIKWININRSKSLDEKLEKLGYSKEYLIK